jgi:hypothetical protein
VEIGMPANIDDTINYLLSTNQPWVQHNTLLNLQKKPRNNSQVKKYKKETIDHPKIQELIKDNQTWPGYSLKRHNDAAHPIHKIAMLADFGLKAEDPGINEIIEKILLYRSEEGLFQSQLEIPPRYGGSGTPVMSWMLCDAPLLLYSLQKFGVKDKRVNNALEHLLSLVDDNGWRCITSMGFRGPGRKADHCPYANLISMKALVENPKYFDSDAVRIGVEAQLEHWRNRSGRKFYLFGIGTTFGRLKYPHVWYDILHVLDVLSKTPYVKEDSRFVEMLNYVNRKQLDNGGYVPESVWRVFKDWSFGQKKESSPWLSYKIALINSRIN